MLTFLDGPAAPCKTLCIRRVPVWLRVTHREGRGGTQATGAWDALDQLSDQAEPGETLYVYRLVSHDGHVFIDGTDKQGRRRGICAAIATYRFAEAQPADGVLRDNRRWAEWVLVQKQQEEKT